MQINIVHDADRDKRDHLSLIVKGLNAEFHRIKGNNPLGYMDEWESRQDSLLIEVVAALGGKVEWKSGQPVANFTQHSVQDMG